MIYSECYNDSLTLQYLGYDYFEDFTHKLGKGKVLRSMKNTSDSLGIIDEDPRGGTYPQLENYPVEVRKQGLILRRNEHTNAKTLIEIPNELEKWLKNIAKNLGLPIDNYGITNRTGNIKKRLDKSDRDRKRYFDFLDDIKDHASFQQFKTWINQLS